MYIKYIFVWKNTALSVNPIYSYSHYEWKLKKIRVLNSYILSLLWMSILYSKQLKMQLFYMPIKNKTKQKQKTKSDDKMLYKNSWRLDRDWWGGE